MTAQERPGEPQRLVERYDALVELEAAMVVRHVVGWRLLSAGLVRPGRWWAEYEHFPDQG